MPMIDAGQIVRDHIEELESRIKELEDVLREAIVWLDWDDEQQNVVVERARRALRGHSNA